jgi:predicted alpha/beta superfamily hydrolase
MKNRIFITVVFILLTNQTGFAQDNDIVIRDDIRELIINSKILQKKMRVLIWLPENYEFGNENYPAHYLIGGENRFLYYGGVFNYFSLLGDFPKSIIIRAIPNPGFNNAHQNLDKADKFIHYLQNELTPYIDSSFRTNSFRSLWGQSNSGAFTFYSFIRKPELFNAYFMSAPYGLKNFQQSTIERIDNDLKHSKYLYMSFGADDIKEQLEQYSDFRNKINTLQLDKLKFNFDLLDSENHQSIILRNIPDALQSYYSGLSFRKNMDTR